MKSHWGKQELRRLDMMRALVFERDQAVRMRTRVQSQTMRAQEETEQTPLSGELDLRAESDQGT